MRSSTADLTPPRKNTILMYAFIENLNENSVLGYFLALTSKISDFCKYSNDTSLKKFVRYFLTRIQFEFFLESVLLQFFTKFLSLFSGILAPV